MESKDFSVKALEAAFDLLAQATIASNVQVDLRIDRGKKRKRVGFEGVEDEVEDVEEVDNRGKLFLILEDSIFLMPIDVQTTSVSPPT